MQLDIRNVSSIMSIEKGNQLEKTVRNAEYMDMIDRGIAQLSAGNGQEHELNETDWGCKLVWLAYNIDENGFLWIIACRGYYED